MRRYDHFAMTRRSLLLAAGAAGALTLGSLPGAAQTDARLEHLTDPLFDEAPRNEGCGEGGEGQMDVGSALVAGSKAAELAEPCQCPLHYPPVPPEPRTALDTAPSDARLNVAADQGTTAAAMIVRLVGVELAGPAPGWSPGLPDRRHGIDHLLQHDAVVNVGSRQADRERDALRIGEDVTLGARLAPICRVRACRRAPLLAATEALSRAARLKSMALRRPKRSSSTRWSVSHTPACCQSRRRRQQVMPEPQPISWGSISQGMPERRTNRMPVRAARSGTRGRPPLGLGGSGGRRGSITAQRASDTRGWLIPS